MIPSHVKFPISIVHSGRQKGENKGNRRGIFQSYTWYKMQSGKRKAKVKKFGFSVETNFLVVVVDLIA